MNHRIVSSRGAVLAALVALAGVSLAHAADATDKYGADKAKPAKSVLQPSLTGQLDAAALADAIDRAVDQRLAAEKVRASPRADDAEFLRRVFLDLAGHIPSPDRAAAFLDGREPDKRAKLIDELLASDDYGKHQADVWKDLLVTRNSDNRFVDFDPLVEWLTKNFNQNTPWDQTVRDLLTAEGRQDENGAVTYFLANNTVDKMTDVTTKVFLGVQLQCAQCHNHPFTDWKQTEYWGMADFFMKVRLTGPRNPKQDGVPGIAENDGLRAGRKMPLPDSAKTVPAKFLGGPEVNLGSKPKVRPVLAQWLTTAENPYFSKATVNRAWFQLFGRGLVNPVDDLNNDQNPASHPQLLVDLADQFSRNGFDLKQMFRALCNSQVYQRTSKPTADNADADSALYAHTAVKVMTPEQQFDSLLRVLAPNQDPRNMAMPRFEGQAKMKLARYPGLNARSLFVTFFGAEDPGDPTEYQEGIPQALRLMNGPQLNGATALVLLVKRGQPPEQNIERLFLATLSRRPTAAERQRLVGYVAAHKGEDHEGYEDVLWVLLNGSEFVLNH